MPLTGELLIGQSARRGTNGEVFGSDAASGEKLRPGFGGATLDDLEQAATLAASAFRPYRETSLEARAKFLEAIAQNILDIGDELIERCVNESGLPRGRIEGERGRTVGQLRLFANVVRDGGFIGARIDPAMPDRTPLPRPDIRLRQIGVGPVAVFGASNFPLAFSVAGGDTASALAAGCPVIVKAHSAHPGTSELVGRAVQRAVKECGMPEGTFSLLFDSGRSIGQGLVADHRIKAAGFTGSRAGGTALMKIAAARPEPIPVYAEMSSINPVLLFPGALAARGEAIGKAFVGALTLGAGQFCTNPGLILAVDGDGLEGFVEGAKAALASAPAATMLTPGIHKAYCEGVSRLKSHSQVQMLGEGTVGERFQGQAALFDTTAGDFLKHPELQEEVFGSSSLLVRCKDEDELGKVLDKLEGQLTIALHLEASDFEAARRFMPILEEKAGRVLVNGFGTGVEVGHAMVHGGPYPATSDGRTTSVGSLAITRFLRPVSYQDVPGDLLPPALSDDNPFGIQRKMDGR
ncbi:2,5-dioxovalerate dehydrogenase [Skermanella stibiiresistens SB22]|uniref:2,5-dioxovalerate dehydrogenase n=1 Tax=Skermanella stibiiresistens SB22 TaxID=1385369 RepID=W9GPP7_9PROT|nr:aldehyde dehydrogenase (NADP(+)) [Skermanella stibiiresistens]EWY35870.1 2,5-dioxovalerate dehydrogenase [Skermanella stibiiresistens SB22]